MSEKAVLWSLAVSRKLDPGRDLRPVETTQEEGTSVTKVYSAQAEAVTSRRRLGDNGVDRLRRRVHCSVV
jgi:hypothetical protein